MKNRILLSVFTFLFLFLSGMDIQAQPITHYRTTNIYLCLPFERDAHGSHNYPNDRHIYTSPLFVQGFQTDRTEPYTIYGVAVSVCPSEDYSNYNPYTLEGCTWRTDGEIDTYIYEATVGDSAVELVKRSSHYIPAGKVPDRLLVIQDSGLVGYMGSLVNRAAIYMHEFYFDEPVTVSNPFLVGMSGKSDLRVADFVTQYALNHTYYGYVDVETGRLVDSRYHSVLFPDINTVPTSHQVQILFPILVPEGSAIGTSQVQESVGLRLFPNPARTKVRVEAGCAVREVVVSDMVGRTVLHRDCHGGELGVTLDVSRLPQGCYAVHVGTDRGTMTEKLVVE